MSMMRLTLLSTLALISALLAQASAFIVFHNLTTKAPITGALYLPRSYDGTKIGISLRERPPGQVVVVHGTEIDANGNPGTVLPDKQPCTTIFTPTNWNVPQSVTLANPMQAQLLPNALTAPVKFQAFSSECGYKDHGAVANLDVNRQAFPNTQCSIRIAPEGVHVNAFGEVPYHFMHEGSFFILRTDAFAIVATMRRHRNGAAYMSRLTFVGRQSKVDIVPSNVSFSRLKTSRAPMSMSMPPPDVSVTGYNVKTRAEQYTLTFRSGLSIQLTATGGDRPDINDILIRPDLELSRRGVTNGWCGAFDASLPHNKPVDMFRADSAQYEAKQLALDSSTVPRTSPKYAGTSLVKFIKATRAPENLYQFSAQFVSHSGRIPLLMTRTCPAVNRAEFACTSRPGAGKAIGFRRAESGSLFSGGSPHCLDGADCDSAAGDEEGADDALFSIEESNVVSDGFEDAMDQFWDELAGSDEF